MSDPKIVDQATVYFDPKVKDEIRVYAARTRRSLTKAVEWLCIQGLEAERQGDNRPTA